MHVCSVWMQEIKEEVLRRQNSEHFVFSLVSNVMAPFEVVPMDGKLCCLNNRLLTDLKKYQATRQHKSIRVQCVVRPPDIMF